MGFQVYTLAHRTKAPPWPREFKLQTFHSRLPFLSIMSRTPVAGFVSMKDGEAVLHVSPLRVSTSASSREDAAPPSAPWDSNSRQDDVILTPVNEEKIQVHHSRLPMTPLDLRLLLNNMQTTCKLKVGMEKETGVRTPRRGSWHTSCSSSREEAVAQV